MYKNIPLNDNALKFTGVWQKNQNDEVVSYGTVSWFEVGFTGCELCLKIKIQGDVVFYLDGEILSTKISEDNFTIKTTDKKHCLKIKTVPDSRVYLKGISIPSGENVFRTNDKKYIQFIGDSITYKYPGYSSTTGDILGVDYSVVAYCGMSLKDTWGWYKLPEGITARPGMESMYFKLERPHETINFTNYEFQFLRIPDVLVIALGTNDYLNSSQEKENGNIEAFISSYFNFVAKLREKYPNTKVYILKPFNESYCRDEAVSAAFNEIQNKLGNAELIDSINWNVEICSDGTHPTDFGYSQIAENLSAVLDKEK